MTPSALTRINTAMRTRFAATENRQPALKSDRLWWWRGAFLAARWRGC